MTVRTKLATFGAVLALTFGAAYGVGTAVDLDEPDPPTDTTPATDTTPTTHDEHPATTQGAEG